MAALAEGVAAGDERDGSSSFIAMRVARDCRYWHDVWFRLSKAAMNTLVGLGSAASRLCKGGWSVAIPLAVASALHFWLTSNQARIDVNGGLGYDGYHYMAMAESMVKGDKITEPGPFAYRVLTPYLASLNSRDPYQGFVLVGIVANFCSVALLHLWLLRRLKAPWLATSLSLAFLLMVHGPFRFHYYYPNLTDPLAFLCFVLGYLSLTLSHRSWQNIVLTSLLAVAGVLVRETLLVFPLAYFFGAWKSEGAGRREKLLVAGIPFALGLGTLLLVHGVVTSTGSYSSYDEALRFLYSKSLPRYIHAWLLVFGPLLAVPLAFPELALGYLRRRPGLSVHVLAITVLAFIGGNDTERFIVWTVPPILLLVGELGQRWKPTSVERLLLMLTLGIAFIVSQRFISPIPPINPTLSNVFGIWLVPQGAGPSYLELKSWDCSQATSVTGLTQLLLACALLAVSLRMSASRAKWRLCTRG